VAVVWFGLLVFKVANCDHALEYLNPQHFDFILIVIFAHFCFQIISIKPIHCPLKSAFKVGFEVICGLLCCHDVVWIGLVLNIGHHMAHIGDVRTSAK
jgi:hypothetical protein